MDEKIYESNVSKTENTALLEHQTINVLNENIMFDFFNVFKTIFLTFYDDEYVESTDIEMQAIQFKNFMELRAKLDESLKRYCGLLDDTPLHQLITITKNLSFPPEKNSFYEDEYQFPRVSEGKLFEIKDCWESNEYFIENKLVVNVGLLNAALKLLSELIIADYGEDIQEIR